MTQRVISMHRRKATIVYGLSALFVGQLIVSIVATVLLDRKLTCSMWIPSI